MEPSFKTITVDKEIKFKKTDLVALKDSVYMYCFVESALYPVCSISNVKYVLNIYPNGSEDAERGQTWLYLFLKLGSARNVEVNLDIQSADTSINIKQKYEPPEDSCGNQICTTEELFDSTKKFFVIDEMIIKIKGTMKIYLPTNKITYPFSAQWKIKQTDLEDLKTSIDDDTNYLWSDEFELATDSEIAYELQFCPNGDAGNGRGKVLLYFFLELGSAKKLEAVYNISIDSANYTHDDEHVFEKRVGFRSGYSNEICSTEELFKSENGYFIDGEMLIKVSGTVSMEKEKESLTAMGCEENTVKKDHTVDDGKNFTIFVGEKSIKVHKQLLLDSSPYFIGLFNSGMIESNEMKTTITDFNYEIVEAGIQILYNPTKIPSNFSFEQMLELLHFSDKYDFGIIKDLIQNHFIENISPTNVCIFINYTTTTVSAPKLHSKCIDYIIKRSEEKMAILGLETLEKDFWLKILTGTFVKNF